MLALLTGPVRSGKSQQGFALAQASGRPVFIAVGGTPSDGEMARRIDRHRLERTGDVVVIETSADPAWRERVPNEACLLVDCLGTVLASDMATLVADGADEIEAEAEAAAQEQADALVAWLLARQAPTVVVTNEVGWGVVPATPLGRLFRDVLGRANRTLGSGANVAWLVVAGRMIELHTLTQEVSWPEND